MTWIRRTIWQEGDRYEAADNADVSQVANDACVLAANLGAAITVHVDGLALKVEPGADPAVLRRTVEKSRKRKKTAKKAVKKAPAKKAVKKAAGKKAVAKKPAKKAVKRSRR